MAQAVDTAGDDLAIVSRPDELAKTISTFAATAGKY